VAELLRVAWRTVGRVCARVAAEQATMIDLLEGLGRIGIDEISYKKGQRYLTVRDAADCPAVDAYRQSLIDGTPITPPAPLTDCPAQFGNEDIYGGTYLDPTP
jgi:hypothetical protein